MTTPFQPGYSSLTPVAAPAGFTDAHTYSPSSAMTLQATTPLAGFALQNATPNILTWVAPNDGNAHSVMITGSEVVSSLETGGALQVTFTAPTGASHATSLSAGGLAAGTYALLNAINIVVGPGTSVTVQQNTALTGGAAIIYCAIWGA